MKNLNKLGLILGCGTMSALIFSLAACGDDDDTPSGGAAGKATTAGTGGTGGGSGGASTGGGGAATGGGGMKATGGGGASTGGGGAGGGGAGGKGGAGGSAGSGGGGGGSGGAPSAACTKLCMGADSIVTVCAAEAGIDASLKATPSCLARCAKETDMAKVGCWQLHTTNFKTMAGDHCKHAGGKSVCMPWPAE